jgi:hypothetical protein
VRCFVGNLDFAMNDEAALREAFAAVGASVRDIYIPTDRWVVVVVVVVVVVAVVGGQVVAWRGWFDGVELGPGCPRVWILSVCLCCPSGWLALSVCRVHTQGHPKVLRGGVHQLCLGAGGGDGGGLPRHAAPRPRSAHRVRAASLWIHVTGDALCERR